MNILNMEHISKLYGDKQIFEDVSFGLQEGDKVGIIGINGTGKSTLLKIAAGLEEADSGQVTCQNGLRISYLPQDPEFPREATVASYALDGVQETDWKVQSMLNQLGIPRLDARLDELSGGQKRRVAMAKAFSAEADVLLLDEPTNHMDEAMLDWLEQYLRAFKGAVLMVTHDRYFLDQVSNKILEISHGSVYEYEANYSGFLERKAEREEMELASQRKRQSILRMELEWAKRGCRARSTKQKARLQRLEELKNTAAPVKDQAVELDSVHARMGKKTLELSHVSKRYGEKKILEDFSYIFLKNQTVGFIGPNGCGKSTLMKLLVTALLPTGGATDKNFRNRMEPNTATPKVTTNTATFFGSTEPSVTTIPPVLAAFPANSRPMRATTGPMAAGGRMTSIQREPNFQIIRARTQPKIPTATKPPWA